MLANDENSFGRNSTDLLIYSHDDAAVSLKFAKAGLPERNGVGGEGRINKLFIKWCCDVVKSITSFQNIGEEVVFIFIA